MAIGQSGDGVEMRHVLDLSLGVEAVGDILNDEDGAFGVHGVDGQLDGAAIACLDIYGGVRTEALVREEGLVAQHILRVGDELRNGFAEKGVDVASCQQRLGRERQDRPELVVENDDPPFAVECAKAVRHVVDGGVELRCDLLRLFAKSDLVEQGLPEFGGGLVNEEAKRRQGDGRDEKKEPAFENAGRCERQSAGANLKDDPVSQSEISDRDRQEVEHYDGKADRQDERIIGNPECRDCQKSRTKKCADASEDQASLYRLELLRIVGKERCAISPD